MITNMITMSTRTTINKMFRLFIIIFENMNKDMKYANTST